MTSSSARKWTNSVGYVGVKSRQRWLFYAYDRLRKTVVAYSVGNALWRRWAVL
ncbi:IS1 family transposase [Serratia marcescens]|uniref:IS1 family transposase n=1 Tax=Serratia marcescens TaxID=615 RepID=UPI0038B35982